MYSREWEKHTCQVETLLQILNLYKFGHKDVLIETDLVKLYHSNMTLVELSTSFDLVSWGNPMVSIGKSPLIPPKKFGEVLQNLL